MIITIIDKNQVTKITVPDDDIARIKVIDDCNDDTIRLIIR